MNNHDVERRYFANKVNLKAQIAKLEDGRFCLTRYSYPDKVSHNAVVEQHITKTYEQAKAIMDRIYDNKADEAFHMHEVDEDSFLETFKDDGSPIEVNHYGIALSVVNSGWTQDILVRIGRKLYWMDIRKDSFSAVIGLYNYVSKDRSSFSKYSPEADLHEAFVKPDAYIDRDFLEHIAEIEDAQSVYRRYSASLLTI